MQTVTAQLIKKTALSPDTSDFAFEIEAGRFQGLEAGAHVDVHLGADLVRQYSIWSWSLDGRTLNVAVKREDEGRGGSRAIHALEEGAKVQIGGPRNHFKLQSNASYVTLIAGGIGATPIVAMARQLLNEGRDFQVIYLVRNRELAAMDAKFRALGLDQWYRLHCDETDGVFDLAALMRSLPLDSDVYTCGPEPMLNAVLDAGSAMRGGTIHFERFAASSEVDHGASETFEIEVASSGAVYDVGTDDTVLEVLKSNGVHVDFGCSEGLCGSCMVDVIEGEIDHRDGILTPEEQATNSYMCACVSRAKGKRLVLDL
ncbi:2Fe-2S iron-sulfur cluster binding domain-containing protein [Epibacterium sp. SM1969]|uniref:2Fe-2S iron-sulfur cluster binding domain-containing protein n=1 Tax=Tritonibacter aquimaris TaxID=2663379 RepID=A0A844AWE7_9RHOB|nr:PDR/VanB family oxidoreductase [Tritonibacter aquimaris]MQY43858.1 2Fe-2S iron-sulfur cluster binding domain-containing protein [Tritonibacter aquimaris]